MDPFDHEARRVVLEMERLGCFIPPEKRETLVDFTAGVLRRAHIACVKAMAADVERRASLAEIAAGDEATYQGAAS